MDKNLHIRVAEKSDIPLLIEIEHLVATAAHWSPSQYDDIFERRSPSRVAWIALLDSEPVGFLVARLLGAEAEIENIVVRPSVRRLGIGRKLFQCLRRLAAQQLASHILLEVRASNYDAQAFYASLGFQQIGLRRAYYRDPAEDAVLYRRSVP